MEVKDQVTTKSMPYEAWKDNEYIEKLVQELRDSGTNVLVGSLDKLINWGRSNSIWPLTFATSCCGIEFVSLGAARFDMARFGWEVARASPRQADFMMVAGTIVNRMRDLGRPVPQIISCRQRHRGYCACRRFRSRLSSASRSDDLRNHAALPQNKS